VVGIAASPIANVIVADQTTTVELPGNVSAHDAASLPASLLPAWIALADPGRVSGSTAVLVHDAASRVFFFFHFLKDSIYIT
jgi:NADPH:quinone reductase-like Zn-dependent oxidoreductase